MHSYFYNRNLIYTIALKIWSAIAGFLVLAVLTITLNKNEIGYYYLFYSTLAIQGILELGILTVTQNYISKYYYGKNFSDIQYKVKFKKLIGAINTYFLFITFIYFILINIILMISINEECPDKNFYISWVLFSIASCLNFFIMPNYTILDGLGKFATSSIIKLISSVLSIVIFIICIYSDFGIVSAGIYQLSIFLSSVAMLYSLNKSLFKFRIEFKHLYLFIRKNFVFQKNMVLTMIAGYFIFSLYVPFTFRNYGPIPAGQIGLIISTFGLLLSISNSFMQTNVPNLVSAINNKDYEKEKNIFKKCFINSILFSVFSCTFVYITIFTLRQYELMNYYMDKFPDNYIILVFSFYFLANSLCANFSIYLRTKNKEIFTSENLIMGIITIILLFFLTDISYWLYITIIPTIFILLFPVMYYRKFNIDRKINEFV